MDIISILWSGSSADIVQAATSFECDGCNHHASFHNLDNPDDDAVLARWASEERSVNSTPQTNSQSNKRRRIENGSSRVSGPLLSKTSIHIPEHLESAKEVHG